MNTMTKHIRNRFSNNHVSQLPIKVSKNYRKKVEHVDTNFEGALIDIETIGQFYGPWRDTPPLGSDYISRYKLMRITTVGILSDDTLTIFIANDVDCLDAFQKKAMEIMRRSNKPCYAFNKTFEEGCYFWNSGRKILEYEYELQQYPLEKKENVVMQLGIDDYRDPFHGDGSKCKKAFLKGDLKSIISHNRACLLKESKILEKRGAQRLATTWLDLDEI
jgi:hypothetical protein